MLCSDVQHSNSVTYIWASLVAQLVKNPPALQETLLWYLGWENPLEEGMAIHSSILAWRIPWTGKPSGLQSIGSQRIREDWNHLAGSHPSFVKWLLHNSGKGYATDSTKVSPLGQRSFPRCWGAGHLCDMGPAEPCSILDWVQQSLSLYRQKLGKWFREGNGTPLQYSCLENSTDRGAWWATVHRVTKNQTWLKQLSTHEYWIEFIRSVFYFELCITVFIE